MPGDPRARCATAGWALIVVSNWDVSLDEVLVETGLRELVDGVVTSVAVGEPKPGGAAFARGLELAGARAAEAWHAGDDLEADVAGALAAGIRPVLVDRDGDGRPPPRGVPVVRALDELPALGPVGPGLARPQDRPSTFPGSADVERPAPFLPAPRVAAAAARAPRGHRAR